MAEKTMKYFSVEFASLFCGSGTRKLLLEIPTPPSTHPKYLGVQQEVETYLSAHVVLLSCCD